MDVVFLGSVDNPVLQFLQRQHAVVVQTDQEIGAQNLETLNNPFLVSFGYRYIIKENVLSCVENRAVNLHISLLPFNRGADPNFWSFIEGTPKGVSIHLMDKDLDTGPILVQKEVFFDKESTLRSTYERLQSEAQQLFMQHWHDIREGLITPKQQTAPGTFHKSGDKQLLIQGIEDSYLDWDIEKLKIFIFTKHNLRKNQAC